MTHKKKQKGKKEVIQKIEAIYRQYYRQLIYSAFQYCKRKDLSEDIVQQAFSKILVYPETIKKLDAKEAFYFMLKVVRNTAFSMIQTENKNQHDSLEYEDGEDTMVLADPNDDFIRLININSLESLLNTISPKLRDVMVLHYLYGMKYQEISMLLNISESAAKKRCSLAKARLIAKIKKGGNDNYEGS